jgi:hypothetical protein
MAVFAAVAAGLLFPGSGTAFATDTGTCGGQPASAIDQYCEVIPGATGGHGTGPGTRELASALPPRVAKRLWFDYKHRRLLTIPAAVRIHHATGAQGPAAGSVSSSSVWWPMVVVLVLLAMLLASLDAIRRRRRRARLQPS